ncbi:unnamed protein product, partial [Rotaria sordida]
MVTFFDDLPDLTLLEILSYLSCADALWTFSTLNNRLTMLLLERGVNRNVNLSSTQYYQFQKLLPLLRLNEIDSLIIDCYASALQLTKWPYLPHLKKLQIKGVCNYFDICHFVMQHANTLTHLTIESSWYHLRSFKWHFMEEWTLLDMLTSSRVMPILRRMTFSIVINAVDLNHMNHSAIFTDYRHVDVHYAFIFDDNRSHSELSKFVPYGSQSHPREIASGTFISECWPDSQPFETPGEKYGEKPKNRQHLFYTLPWTFNEFQLCVPDRCISELQVFTSFSSGNKTFYSRL